MICFRSLIFWYLQQLLKNEKSILAGCDLLSFFDFLIFTTIVSDEGYVENCCDLLSFFDFLIFTTIRCKIYVQSLQLWFAFVLWFSDIYNNIAIYKVGSNPVVICFRSLIFWYLQQYTPLYISEYQYVKSDIRNKKSNICQNVLPRIGAFFLSEHL